MKHSVTSKLAAAAVAIGLTLGLAPSSAHAASYKTFHPRKHVTARQIAPGRMKFVNRTQFCVALKVTQRKNGVAYTATHRIDHTFQTDRLWVRARVVRVTVYRPGCY